MKFAAPDRDLGLAIFLEGIGGWGLGFWGFNFLNPFIVYYLFNRGSFIVKGLGLLCHCD